MASNFIETTNFEESDEVEDVPKVYKAYDTLKPNAKRVKKPIKTFKILKKFNFVFYFKNRLRAFQDAKFMAFQSTMTRPETVIFCGMLLEKMQKNR